MSHFQLLLGLFAQFGGDFATICGWRRGGKMWQGLSGLCRFNNRLLKTSTGLAMWWALIGQARRLRDLCFNIEIFMSVSCNAKKTSLGILTPLNINWRWFFCWNIIAAKECACLLHFLCDLFCVYATWSSWKCINGSPFCGFPLSSSTSHQLATNGWRQTFQSLGARVPSTMIAQGSSSLQICPNMSLQPGGCDLSDSWLVVKKRWSGH